MTAFDLVNYSHRDGRAWKSVYDGSRDKTITVEDIKGSKDVLEYPQPEGTLAKSVDSVRKDFKNTLRLLGDARKKESALYLLSETSLSRRFPKLRAAFSVSLSKKEAYQSPVRIKLALSPGSRPHLE